MAYPSSASRRLAPVTAVALVHVAIGYAFISGLAMKVIPWVPTTIALQSYKDDTPPPPIPPEQKVRPKQAPATVQPRIVDAGEITIVDLTPVRIDSDVKIVQPLPPVTPTVTPPVRDLSQKAVPKGRRASWITTDDYPLSAIRAEQEGVVGISVRIGASGRVTECTVTQPSGSSVLDEATCRLYARRAEFTLARDADGNPITSSYSDRVSWKLP